MNMNQGSAKSKMKKSKVGSSRKPVVSRGNGRLLNSKFWLLTTKSKLYYLTVSLPSKVFHSKTEVTQDCGEGASRDIASGSGDSGKTPVFRVPPDFVRARSLADKLAAQLGKFLSQYTIGHTGTRSSA